MSSKEALIETPYKMRWELIYNFIFILEHMYSTKWETFMESRF